MSLLPYDSHDDLIEKPHDFTMKRQTTCMGDLADTGGLH